MSDILPCSLNEARRIGSKFYFTGVPCVHGHLCKRRTVNAGCTECQRVSAYNRSKLPSVKEANRISKQKDEYKKKQKDYAKSKASYSQVPQGIDVSHIENEKKRSKEYARIYYEKNRERIKKKASAYQAENAKDRTNYKREWAKERAKKDPAFKMGLVARRMLQRALGVSGQSKYKRTKDHLGYTSEQLVLALESKFKDGMSWSNYGEWHIDHIKPIKAFIGEGIKDPSVMNAIDNLQPLWAYENLKKGCKYESI